MSLYQRHRPTTLETVVGNTETINSLKKLLESGKAPHSYLLTGGTGCGKTTVARIIADRLGCVGNDFREVDNANFRGIDTVREIIKQTAYSALEGACRVWLIDECHKMTNDAQNALLKILEDTPKHVYFILCTTDPQKLIPTIKSRCSTFQFNPLSDEDMGKLINRVIRRERVTLSPEVIAMIIQSGQGYPRATLTILEQVLNADESERELVAQRKAEEHSEMIELARALMNPKSTWKQVAGILKGLKEQDAEGIRRVVLGYASAILLNGADNTLAGLVMEEFMEPTFNSGFSQLVFASYSIIKNR